MVENMDSPKTPKPHDHRRRHFTFERDLEELMNMSMVTDRQNLMIQN